MVYNDFINDMEYYLRWMGTSPTSSLKNFRLFNEVFLILRLHKLKVELTSSDTFISKSEKQVYNYFTSLTSRVFLVRKRLLMDEKLMKLRKFSLVMGRLHFIPVCPCSLFKCKSNT